MKSMFAKQPTARTPKSRRGWRSRSTRSLPRSAANSRARGAAMLLVAGSVLIAFGCGHRSTVGLAGGGRAPPATAAADSPGSESGRPEKPSTTAVQRYAADDDAKMILTVDERVVGLGKTIEVPLGAEVAVRERLVSKHLEDVSWYTRSWGVSRGGANSVEKTRNVRTDAGLVVIGGDATSWEDNEKRTKCRIHPISHGSRGDLEYVRDYRLRFMRPGWYVVEVTWDAGTPR